MKVSECKPQHSVVSSI